MKHTREGGRDYPQRSDGKQRGRTDSHLGRPKPGNTEHDKHCQKERSAGKSRQLQKLINIYGENNREIPVCGQVVKNNPMTNPENGWVQGFYYQDLCGGEIKHFILGGSLRWEVKPETVGMFTGFHNSSEEQKPIFNGDILHTVFSDGSSCAAS